MKRAPPDALESDASQRKKIASVMKPITLDHYNEFIKGELTFKVDVWLQNETKLFVDIDLVECLPNFPRSSERVVSPTPLSQEKKIRNKLTDTCEQARILLQLFLSFRNEKRKCISSSPMFPSFASPQRSFFGNAMIPHIYEVAMKYFLEKNANSCLIIVNDCIYVARDEGDTAEKI